MNIIGFAASSSRKSINKQLVTFAATLLPLAQVEILDLNDYELPLFSEDREKEIGKPALAHNFLEKIGGCDAVIISFAEHNGSYSTAYKNLFDWCSRINPKVFQGRPMVFLSTSPGPGGGARVLAGALNSAPSFNGQVRSSFSLPRFYDNFDVENACIRSPEMLSELTGVMNKLND